MAARLIYSSIFNHLTVYTLTVKVTWWSERSDDCRCILLVTQAKKQAKVSRVSLSAPQLHVCEMQGTARCDVVVDPNKRRDDSCIATTHCTSPSILMANKQTKKEEALSFCSVLPHKHDPVIHATSGQVRCTERFLARPTMSGFTFSLIITLSVTTGNDNRLIIADKSPIPDDKDVRIQKNDYRLFISDYRQKPTINQWCVLINMFFGGK